MRWINPDEIRRRSAIAVAVHAQTVPASLFTDLEWRLIGRSGEAERCGEPAL